jgi:hypothetical protein
MKLNRTLAIIALVLLAASIWTYRSSLVRADRFERGQRFLPNLNPDDVAEIAISRGDEHVTLKRGEDGFTVTEIHGYPAANESVNRVLRTLVELELDKKVGTGDDLYRELGLTVDSPEMTELRLRAADGADMVVMRVGKTFTGGDGSYLRRLDGDGGPAYLSTRRVSLNTTADSFLDKEILNIPAEEIARIDGRDFAVMRTGDGLELDRVPAGMRENPSAMSRAKDILSLLRFDEVYLADDDTLTGLDMRQVADVRLTDGSGYRLAVAERDGEHFLQVSGYHTVNRMSVDRDESTEELENKAEILARADEISRFNRFHGSWIYRINDTTADKLALTKADLIQAES